MKKQTLIGKLLLFLTCLTLPHTSYSQDGSLDVTFGVGGKVVTPIGKNNDEGLALAIQSDGKIVVAGYSLNGTGNDYDFALARYNTNGNLDNTFGTNGKVITPIGNSDDKGCAVAIQSDGKIVVAGYSYNSSDYDFALVCYNSNGSLDNTFGTNGKVITTIGNSGNKGYADDYGYALAIQSDGKIVVAGVSANVSNYSYDFALVRYNRNGSLDNTFGNNGKVITSVGLYNDYAHSLGIQSDGKIVVAGYCKNGSDNNAESNFALVRYNTNGSIDYTFGVSGKVITPIENSRDEGWSLAIQTDGKIVVAGDSNYGSNFALLRYNTNGSLDTAFGVIGKVITPIGNNNNYGRSLAIQSDGKIVVAGFTYNNGNEDDFALVRYNTNGSLDNTFGSDGKVVTPIGYDDGGSSLAIQSDDKIVVAGASSIEYGSTFDFAVVRYNNSITNEISTPPNQKTELDFYPNPFSNSTVLQIVNCLNSASLSIYNLYGQKIRELENISGQTITIYRDNLSIGIYMIQITQDSKIINLQKLVITD